MGAEIKSVYLTLLPVTPEYIVLVSNPAEIVKPEDESDGALLLRGNSALVAPASGGICIAVSPPHCESICDRRLSFPRHSCRFFQLYDKTCIPLAQTDVRYLEMNVDSCK